jgi:hypothetical protein
MGTLDDNLSTKVCQRETNLVVTEEGKFQCSLCEKSYLYENSLTRHYNWKHKDPVFYNCMKQYVVICNKLNIALKSFSSSSISVPIPV